MNLRPRHREDPEINLISLIDVLLVLLIFFMVSTTFQQEGRVKVQLPQASAVPLPLRMWGNLFSPVSVLKRRFIRRD